MTWRVTMPDGYVVTPPPVRYLDQWNARVRADLGKPPVRDDLPADVRAILEMM